MHIFLFRRYTNNLNSVFLSCFVCLFILFFLLFYLFILLSFYFIYLFFVFIFSFTCSFDFCMPNNAEWNANIVIYLMRS